MSFSLACMIMFLHTSGLDKNSGFKTVISSSVTLLYLFTTAGWLNGLSYA